MSNNVDDSSKIFCNQNNININLNSHKIRKNLYKNNTTIIKHKTSFFDNLKYNEKVKYPLYYYFFGYLYNRADLRKHIKKFFYVLQRSFIGLLHFIGILLILVHIYHFIKILKYLKK